MNFPVPVQIEAVIILILLLIFIQAATLLAFRNYAGTISAALSFPLSLLIVSVLGVWVTWLLLPPVVILAPFLAVFGIVLLRNGTSCLQVIRDSFRVYGLWILSFCFMAGIAAYTMILGTSENVTDFAIMMSLWHQPAIPPHDPWFGGIPMDMYYYLSHLLFATISRISGISPDILFTLAIPTVFSATILGIYAISSLLLSRYRYLPLLTVLLPNLAFVLYLFSGSSLIRALQMSIRVITETNNEYPYYSFVMSVFHAHVISLFNQVVLIAILAVMLLQWQVLQARHRLVLASIAALSFGAMFPLNTWDIAVYGPGLVLAGIWLYIRYGSETTPLPGISSGKWPFFCHSIMSGRYAPLAVFWLFIPILSVFLYLPYHLTQHSVFYGLSPGLSPTDPVQFLLLFGPVLLVLLATLRTSIRSKPYFLILPFLLWIPGYAVAGLILMFLIYFLLRREGVCDYFSILGFWALLVSELLVYGDRFNTVFKFQYCAILLLGLVAWIHIARFLSRLQYPGFQHRFAEPLIQIVLIGGAVVFAAYIAVSCGHAPSLDAVSPLVPHLGGDSDAIGFLRSLPGDHVLIEVTNPTVGGYHPYGRVSTLSGIPAGIGWWKHELQWRMISPEVMAERVRTNNAVYQDPDTAIRNLDLLGADLLYVGTLEKKEYPSIKLPQQGLEKIYEKNGVFIFRRVDTTG